jgi:hypothetical protein
MLAPNWTRSSGRSIRAVELGVLPKPVQIVPKYVDLSLIEEAKKRIDGK